MKKDKPNFVIDQFTTLVIWSLFNVALVYEVGCDLCHSLESERCDGVGRWESRERGRLKRIVEERRILKRRKIKQRAESDL